jgi:hypothetical protein
VTEQPVSARDLRVSDDERRHAVELLERATGRGMLDLEEFTGRVDAALAARTRGELNAVLIDLPGLVHPEAPGSGAYPAVRPPTPAPAVRPVAAPVSASGAVTLSADLGSVSRRGDWEVPAQLRIHVAMGSAELDFTETTIVHPVVELDLDVTAGSVELRVPEGSRVERGDLHVVLGSVSDHVRGGGAGGTTFVLRGSVRAGSVEVRGPKWRWLRKR